MAAELLSNHVVSVAPPGIRPQTRTKVIEILAGTENGCLQELGKLETTNQQLHRDNKKLKVHAGLAEELQKKCILYQSENTKLYEDNTKLIADCETLRAQGLYALLKNLYANAVTELQLRALQMTVLYY
ncbi:hypothetical protein B0H14DRAFT_3512333 [Mycena olivaceomarginata]|nr:hypothetical protein B0H14DRAFT_3512333 [Mycena olivaceomarginata]